MSRIDGLVEALCPDGVEFLELNEVCLEISAGGDLPKVYQKGQTAPSAELLYPIYSNGTGESALYGYTDKYKIDRESVTISARGTIGYHCIRQAKFTPIVRLITLIPNNEIIATEFLNYALDITEIGHSGGSIPQLTVPSVKRLKIPVPPLEIQREIVRILDTFSKMEAELEAELKGRKQQYEHYRSELFGDAKDKRIVTLGELCNSITTGKLDVNAKVDGGAYPFFTCDANPYEIDTYAFDTEAILLSGNGSRVGHVNYYRGKFNAYQRTYVVSDFSEQVHVPYLLQYLHGFFRQYVMVNSRKGSVPYITLPMLKNFQIPLPALTEQKQMSNSLDKFDALVNDLSVGLPAELAARRQQYEYYRDKLLTFKELEPAS
ncbi:MAG: restriction endonuclease subunit S [Glutamicibacter ardleyensis]